MAAEPARQQPQEEHEQQPVAVGGLAVGTLNWGSTPIDRWFNGAGGVVPQDELNAITAECVAAGVRTFDTAEGYGGGTSELRLARALRARGLAMSAGNAGGNDNDDANNNNGENNVLVATKFLPTLWRWTYASFERAVRGSLRRMGVACMPVYFIHTPIHPLPLERWVDHACTAADRGLITHVGLSNCSAEQLARGVAVARRRGRRIYALQLLVNLLDYASPAVQRVLAVCAQEGIRVWAYSPVAQGLLCDNLRREKFDSNKLRRITRVTWEELARVRAAVATVAAAHQCTMAQACLAWTMGHGWTALVGMKRMRQCRDNLGATRLRLTPEQLRALDTAALPRATLEKPRWRRTLFVSLISTLVMAYRACVWWAGDREAM